MELIQKSSTIRNAIRNRLYKFSLTQPTFEDVKIFCDNTARGYDVDYRDIIKFYQMIVINKW